MSASDNTNNEKPVQSESESPEETAQWAFFIVEYVSDKGTGKVTWIFRREDAARKYHKEEVNKIRCPSGVGTNIFRLSRGDEYLFDSEEEEIEYVREGFK